MLLFADTASLLLLAYGHALFSGDGTLIFKYYQLLRKCADYLQENALYPPELFVKQLSGLLAVFAEGLSLFSL